MRQQGTYPESSNIEGKKAWTYDARELVQSYADLLTFNSSNYIPNGFCVNVFDDDDSKRGVYQCINKNDLSNPASWRKIGGNKNIQKATSGNVDPDNDFGAEGDFYIKIPDDNSSVTLYEKGAAFWSLIYTLPLSPISGAVKQFAFTRANITNIIDGMGDLVLPFNGGQISMGLISRAEITEDGIPKGTLVANLSGGPVTSYNQIPDVDQYGIVYYVGEAVEPDPDIDMAVITNNSDQPVDFSMTGEPDGTVDSANSLAFDISIGEAISVTILSTQTCVYTVYNEDNSVYFTHTLIGPGTENGLPFEAGKRQEFIITDSPVAVFIDSGLNNDVFKNTEFTLKAMTTTSLIINEIANGNYWNLNDSETSVLLDESFPYGTNLLSGSPPETDRLMSITTNPLY